METLYIIIGILAALIITSTFIVMKTKPNKKIKKLLEKFSCCG